MKLSETVIRTIGGATLGFLLGYILTIAPVEVRRFFALVLGWLIVGGVAFLILRLDQLHRTGVVLLLGVFAVIIFSDGERAAQIWAYTQYVAGLSGNLIVSNTTQNAGTSLIFWTLTGITLSFLFGYVPWDKWRQANR